MNTAWSGRCFWDACVMEVTGAVIVAVAVGAATQAAIDDWDSSWNWDWSWGGGSTRTPTCRAVAAVAAGAGAATAARTRATARAAATTRPRVDPPRGGPNGPWKPPPPPPWPLLIKQALSDTAPRAASEAETYTEHQRFVDDAFTKAQKDLKFDLAELRGYFKAIPNQVPGENATALPSPAPSPSGTGGGGGDDTGDNPCDRPRSQRFRTGRPSAARRPVPRR